MQEENPQKEFSKAKETVSRLFRYRPRSEKEIVEKLDAKNVSPEVIADIIAYLKKIRLLDDRLFARAWIASRLRKPIGFYRINQELKQKGIDDSIIQEECTKALGSFDEQEAIRTLCQRRLRQYQGLPKLKAKRRLYEYLVRRGFSSESIYSVIKEK